MTIETETHTLPAYWASYLINGDDSALTPKEIKRIERYCKAHSLGSCLSVDNQDEFSWDNDAGELAGAVAEYTFEVINVED
jgi:hypothetical protein